MAVPNKAKLRNALKKMRRISAPDPVTAAQEALDLLSTMAGIKPVALLGRGYGSAAWLEGLLGVAGEAGLHVVQGPYWDAGADAGLPDWYVERARRSLAGLRAYYVCRARAVAAEVAAVPENGAVSVEQEARLLGYPECCVRGYYRAAAAHQRVWMDMARTRAGGDEEAAAQLLDSGEKSRPRPRKKNGAWRRPRRSRRCRSPASTPAKPAPRAVRTRPPRSNRGRRTHSPRRSIGIWWRCCRVDEGRAGAKQVTRRRRNEALSGAKGGKERSERLSRAPLPAPVDRRAVRAPPPSPFQSPGPSSSRRRLPEGPDEMATYFPFGRRSLVGDASASSAVLAETIRFSAKPGSCLSLLFAEHGDERFQRRALFGRERRHWL